jgi:hypothetical protein
MGVVLSPEVAGKVELYLFIALMLAVLWAVFFPFKEKSK